MFMAQPVFYDPRKARWKRIRLAFDLIGVSITLLIIFFAYTALRRRALARPAAGRRRNVRIMR